MLDAFRRSRELVFGLLTVLVILFGVGLITALAQVSMVAVVGVIVVLVLVVGAIALIGAAASGIHTACLYR